MTRARRLLLVTTSLARGGAERQVVDLATRMRSRGWHVAVLSMTHPTDHVGELVDGGVSVMSLDMARGRATLPALLRYVRIVRRWRPDVIHSHMVHANLLARVGRIFNPGIPVVCTVHNVIEGPRWREIAYRLTDPLASATTAVSRAATERYLRVGAVPQGRLTTIPNGFDASSTLVPTNVRETIRAEFGVSDAFLWVTVGRLMPAKGHDLLLSAFAAILQSHPRARLAIAGEGPERPALESLLKELGIEGSASLLGIRRDVSSVLAAADGFVLSSRWEGLPMVLLEAAAARLPIVSTDVGGCREVASADLGAVLVKPDAPSIATGMLEVMDMAATERSAVGERLRNLVVADYDLDSIVSRWEVVYADVARH
jgi:glycosyltransferase involved in cell wall biosynthesis